jgi:hypothetical protein
MLLPKSNRILVLPEAPTAQEAKGGCCRSGNGRRSSMGVQLTDIGPICDLETDRVPEASPQGTLEEDVVCCR